MKPEDDGPEEELSEIEALNVPGHLLRRCHQISVAIFIHECEPFDLTPLQFSVLAALGAQGPQDQATLGGAVALDRTTVAVVVRNLEERGLALRSPSTEDRRAKIVEITPEGAALLEAAMPAVDGAQERMVAPLTENERRTLLRLLSKMARENNGLSRAPMRVKRKG